MAKIESRYRKAVKRLENRLIRVALAKHGDDVHQAAMCLGLHVSYVRARVMRLKKLDREKMPTPVVIQENNLDFKH